MQKEIKVALAATCLLGLTTGLSIGINAYTNEKTVPSSTLPAEMGKHIPTIMRFACLQLNVRLAQVEKLCLFGAARWSMVSYEGNLTNVVKLLDDWVMDVAEELAEHF